MTKPDLLAMMRLLAALESWGLSTQHRLPDYLHEDLVKAVDLLEKEILK